MTDEILGIAHGAEQSRRAAWAKYYAACDELSRWRDEAVGLAAVDTSCDHCGHRWFHELAAPADARDGGHLLVVRTLPLSHWNCWCNQQQEDTECRRGMSDFL